MESKADIVWFTDCDYWFGNGCFDSVRDQWSKLDRPDLIWPFAYLANENKDEIDAFIRHNFETDGEVVPIFEHWTLKSNPRAIGGVQIASGKFVRQHGYLNNHAKWQRPADRPFPDFRDDIVFREMVLKLGVGSSAKIEGLYRMRHTEVGYGVK